MKGGHKEGTQKESPPCPIDGPPPTIQYEYSPVNVLEDNLKRRHKCEYIPGNVRKDNLKCENNFALHEIVYR